MSHRPVPLITLAPEWVKYDRRGEIVHWRIVDRIVDADGVSFKCPKCWQNLGGPIGTHRVTVWRTDRVPDEVQPAPGRWEFAGSDFDDLTLIARTSAYVLGAGCGWTGFVRSGVVTDATAAP